MTESSYSDYNEIIEAALPVLKGVFMRIDNKIISLPPFLSTSWNNIRALYLKGNLLVVTLVDGDTIQIPNLPQDVIEKIFLCHAAYLEQEQPEQHKIPPTRLPFNQAPPEMGGELPVRFAIGSPDQLFAGMQHNPLQANMPDLPPEMIAKISAIAKIMLPNHDSNLIPKSEPHCNCPFCQIARAIHHGVEEPHLLQIHDEEEIVADDDLEFQQWEITPSGEKLFTVTNKLDRDEKYTVFLGSPVGCTCGNTGCEHVVAVLKS